MKANKKTPTIKSNHEQWLDLLSHSIDQYFKKAEKQRQHYKIWWKEMLAEYKEAHPEKSRILPVLLVFIHLSLNCV